jgi:hypothetical protein
LILLLRILEPLHKFNKTPQKLLVNHIQGKQVMTEQWLTTARQQIKEEHYGNNVFFYVKN